MAMSKLGRDIGLSEDDLSPLRRPRYVLSRHLAALFVVLGYLGLVAIVAAILATLEGLRAQDDLRNIHATAIFAGVMLFPFGKALTNIYKRAKLPDWPA